MQMHEIIATRYRYLFLENGSYGNHDVPIARAVYIYRLPILLLMTCDVMLFVCHASRLMPVVPIMALREVAGDESSEWVPGRHWSREGHESRERWNAWLSQIPSC